MRFTCVICGRDIKTMEMRLAETDWGRFFACDDEDDCNNYMEIQEALA